MLSRVQFQEPKAHFQNILVHTISIVWEPLDNVGSTSYFEALKKGPNHLVTTLYLVLFSFESYYWFYKNIDIELTVNKKLLDLPDLPYQIFNLVDLVAP